MKINPKCVFDANMETEKAIWPVLTIDFGIFRPSYAASALLFVRLPTPVFPIVVDGSQLKWQTNEHKVDEMIQVRYTYIIFKFALVLVIGLTQCMIDGRTIGNIHWQLKENI